MKKKFFLYSLLASMLTMLACSDDKAVETPNPNVPDSTVEGILNLRNNHEGQVILPFSATMSWIVDLDIEGDWLSVTPHQGPSGPDYGIVATYAMNDSYQSRTAVVTISNQANHIIYGKYTIVQPGAVRPNEAENPDAPEGMKKNADYLVSQIKVGWCLGNTCEASADGITDDLDTETAWRNPKTSREMFTVLKQAGFNAIRLPVYWTQHADANMTVNDRWLNRIREIVDYAVSQDMYVILNSHHDSWYDRIPMDYNRDEIMEKYKNLWTCIANAFNDYDEHLIFAGANEIVCLTSAGENWGSPSNEMMSLECDLMQQFVDAVRATGGNNQWRCLMVQPWACNARFGMDSRYVFPSDPTLYRLIFEFHCYDPYNYAIGKDKAGYEWAQHEVSDQDYQDLRDLFAQIDENIIAKGTPAIMAEFGSTIDNHHPDGDAVADRIRAEYLEFIVKEAKKYGIPGFFWDNGGFNGSGENFGLLDRKSLSFPDRAQIAVDAIMRGL